MVQEPKGTDRHNRRTKVTAYSAFRNRQGSR
jgi:hypothetical protein